jgi:hypothetical protein
MFDMSIGTPAKIFKLLILFVKRNIKLYIYKAPSINQKMEHEFRLIRSENRISCNSKRKPNFAQLDSKNVILENLF